MSALARYFAAISKDPTIPKKLAISGSDIAPSSITKGLQKEGVQVKFGHKKANIGRDLSLVIYNRAILPNNPELAVAKDLGIRTLPYADALGRITEQYATIAITGSHGKSTTTSLAGLALMKGGLDPTIMVGTNLKELGGTNMRLGHGPYLVLEADDFGGAFTHYSPTIAIVTNIDREHLDFYKSFANLKAAFLKFLANTRTSGAFILNRDDKNLYSLHTQIAAIAKRNEINVLWYSLRDPAAKKIKRTIKIPGVHNVSNALAVYKLGKALGISESKTLAAIGAYQGAWRRMEYRGMFDGGARRARDAKSGALVYDDYAHHPTEIKATLQAFREKYPHKKILCVFQPHQAKRLKALFKDFMTAFKDADKTLLLPIYKVAGRDEKFPKFDSEALARIVQKREPHKLFFYLANPRNLKNAIRALATPLSDHVIVMMGAGDIVNFTDQLISKS